MNSETHCKHTHGARVEGLGCWVCGVCFQTLDQRPVKYGLGTAAIRGTDGPKSHPQIVTWKAEIRKSRDGTTLNSFLAAMARRFMSRDKTLDRREATRLALDTTSAIGVPFSDPDHDWSRTAAIDIADEEMSYWDCEPDAGANS